MPPASLSPGKSTHSVVKILKVHNLIIFVHALTIFIQNGASSPALMCPDGQSQCPDGNTCCKLEDVKGYGCCPQPQAECCADHIHCCPHNYKCSESNTCSKGDSTVPMIERRPAFKAPPMIVCPDYTTQCPNGDTCCLDTVGHYGCCPEPNAVCCTDGKHCCPSGYSCDLTSGECEGEGSVVPFLERRPAIRAPQSRNNICPDQQSECSVNTTCCLLSSGQYGCCPLPNALCCSDKVHCCPVGYTCGVETDTCTKDDSIIPIFKKQPAINAPQNKIICPDQKSECSDSSTCCKLESGQYGCCPISNAVCCGDGEHCCPADYTCEVQKGTCTKGESTIPILKKQPAVNSPQNVMCDDNKTVCASSSTCCKLTSGHYGCCPMTNAKCCSDGVHCCPADYTCNVADGICSKGKSVVPIFKKQPAINAPQNNVCPDQRSECSGSDTCCMLKSGQYGCCPLPNAVCCDDKEHCCPTGDKCNTGSEVCTKGGAFNPIFKKQPAVVPGKKDSTTLVAIKNPPAISKPQSVICPDRASICPDEYTCCRNVTGGYGCCPHVDAVCCDDDKHCCPAGYTCDLISESCNGEGVIMPLFEKQPAAVSVPRNIVCPDGKSQCSDKSTCCLLESGLYGCCPLKNAVCCGDGKHCCPNDYACDMKTGKCTDRDVTMPLFKKQPAINAPRNHLCPDGYSVCSDNNTCCLLASGQYGCCPLPNAMCCGDGEHCCPEGYTCQTSGFCTKGDSVVPLFKKQLALNTPQNNVCPDKQNECSDGDTCCQLKSGQYGCCPQPDAVCCADGEHCCPAGYTCAVEAGTCTKENSAIPILKKQEEAIGAPQNIKCQDEKSECPDKSTCCMLKSGQYGCCPQVNAVCCTDGEHCCPAGYTCNVGDGTCTKGDSASALLVELLTSSVSDPPELYNAITCPDKVSVCPTTSTCCRNTSNGYSCCPHSGGVCCPDLRNCCPRGYACNPDGKTCTRQGTLSIPILKQQPALAAMETTVTKQPVLRSPLTYCPDGTYCSYSETCCILWSGDYGCCPEPSAVCCSDRQYCCRSGYRCNTWDKTCSRGRDTIPMLKKKPTIKIPQNIVCPDGKSECASNNTCCLLKSGEYGCCPVPNAVCCSDGVHCCPMGSICSAATGKCIKENVAVPILKKQPVLHSPQTMIKMPQNVVCPDQKSECSSNSTCCMLKSGQYGCCPVPNALCCKDEEHCCPAGYTCEVGAETCTKGDSVIPMFKKQPAINAPQNNVCPDQRSECSGSDTCCLLKSGQYGCCPLPNAVCCGDKEHCCPTGDKCNTGSEVCTKGGAFIPIFKKQPAINAPQNNVCPDKKSECSSSDTCCLLKSGQYGCCPQLNAVCCNDGEHCCPTGYKCDVQGGTCSKDHSVIPIFKKQPAINAPQVVPCPDNGVCPDNNTCCMLKSGKYGCCPEPKAVCCADGEHCCPNGFECEVDSDNCRKGNTVVPMLTKQLAIPTPQNVICPNHEFQCPNGNTCCLTAGAYRCCSLPNAVCCGDRQHCCPNGYTCNIEKQSCDKEGGVAIPFLENQPAANVPRYVSAKQHDWL